MKYKQELEAIAYELKKARENKQAFKETEAQKEQNKSAREIYSKLMNNLQKEGWVKC